MDRPQESHNPPPDDFTIRTSPTFADGAMLVANAVPDSLLVMRGSACIYEAFTACFGGHDLAQSLLRDGADRRLLDTSEPYTRSILGMEGRAAAVAGQREALAGRRLVLLTEQARITLMGENIRLAAADVSRATGLPCIPATSATLIRDAGTAVASLLDGMAAEALRSVGRRGSGRRRSVGIVGYLHARNEGDACGDVEVLQALVRGLGLKPLPIWLSGAGWDELQRVVQAEVLVALPSGLAAARRLAASTGAAVIEAGLPVALADTEAWVRALAVHFGLEAEADRLIGRELDRVVPLLERYVQPALLGRRAMVVATPDWLPGIVRCLEEDLGLHVVSAVQRARRDQARPDAASQDPSRTFDPSEATLRRHLDTALAGGGVDVVIGSAWERAILHGAHRGIPFVEFGFPQSRTHFLAPTPHLGFQGTTTWAQRLFDALGVD
jgi:nitrogenase molybdenum-iron protein alpha/beta subunit